MFDFSAYIAPAAVLAVMLLALVGFGVWGGRAIKESAEEALAAAQANRKPDVRLAPLVDGPDKEMDVDLPNTKSAENLETTAEFGQAGFAQSFMPEQPEVDFDAAIARITADLEAAENAEEGENKPAVAELPTVDEDIEATAVLKADDRAEILREVEEAENAVNVAADEVVTDVAENEADDMVGDEVEDGGDSLEQTRVMDKLDDLEGDMADGAAVLDKIALEETRTIKQQLDTPAESEPILPAFGEGAEDTAHKDSLFPESPVPFGPKMAWLAIPGYKQSEVISALRLGDVSPANWTKGLSEAYADNKQVFVTPSLSGWVLVIGKTLWQKADMNRSAENIEWLKDVGRLFGNACFFSTMRGLGNHGWVGIRGGNIVRAYGYSGELQELIWLLGEPTEEEIAVNPGFANETEERRMPDFRPVIPDEKMVLAMAAAWSVDVSFSNHKYLPDYGFIGTLE